MTLWRPLAVLSFALPSALLLPVTPASAACNVTVASFSFTPATLTVTPGTTVTWCWTEGPHSVSGSAFDSHPSCTSAGTGCGSNGHTFSHTFPTASGSPFTYVCKVHGSMQGSVKVQQPSPSPSKTPTTKPPTTTPPATRTPTPTRTTVPPTTVPPTILAPTTPPATTTPPTTAPPTTLAPTETPSPTPLPVLDPAPKKARTGRAIAVGLVVAVLALGGATAVWLRSRRRAAG